MTRISAKEVNKVTHKSIGLQEMQYAVELFRQVFAEEQALDDRNGFWNIACAISAVYNAGKINGIRAEREFRRIGKKVRT